MRCNKTTNIKASTTTTARTNEELKESNDHNLYVAGLPQGFTDDQCSQIFVQYGKVEMCKVMLTVDL